MAIDCYCDYDPPEVYSSRMVRAKKQYHCYECRSVIDIGERHEYAFGVTCGYTWTPRTCTHCVAIRRFVKINIPCFCWAHGNLMNDVAGIVDAAYSEAADEVRGLRFGIGRLVVKRKRERRYDWQRTTAPTEVPFQ